MRRHRIRGAANEFVEGLRNVAVDWKKECVMHAWFSALLKAPVYLLV